MLENFMNIINYITEVSTTPATPSRPQTTTQRPAPSSPKPLRPCRGECVSGLFALFCDDIDTGAYCADEGSCCITGTLPPRDPHTTISALLTAPTTPTTTRYGDHYYI